LSAANTFTVNNNWTFIFTATGLNVTFNANIGAYAFHGGNINGSATRTRLTSVTIGEDVTSIGSNAFNWCMSLTSVTIGSGVTSIGSNAFNSCMSLTDITINTDKVTTFDGWELPAANTFGTASSNNWGTIFEANGLSVTFNANIGAYAFSFSSANSTKLTSVTIGEGVTSIGNNAFQYCTGLTSVTFASGSAITSENFGSSAFPQGTTGGGDNLRTAYLNANTGGAGTYTRASSGSTWTKQP